MARPLKSFRRSICKPLAQVAHGKAADVALAAEAAKAAFPAWRAMEGEARKTLLHKIADAIEARAEEIAFVECDGHRPVAFASWPRPRCAAPKTSASSPISRPQARDGQTLRAKGQVNMTTRTPIGPVGIITPWNTPFMLSTWKIAPALAAGCTVVHKPAEFSPLSARLLVEIAESAGLPAGRLEPRQRPGRRCRPGADRTSRHQGDRFCRRKPHRLDDHEAGRRHAEARAFRTGRQEPGRSSLPMPIWSAPPMPPSS